MSLTELLPAVRALPRAERIRLVHLLIDELARPQEPPALQDGASYPVWSPYGAHEAAASLLRLLEDERAKQ